MSNVVSIQPQPSPPPQALHFRLWRSGRYHKLCAPSFALLGTEGVPTTPYRSFVTCGDCTRLLDAR